MARGSRRRRKEVVRWAHCERSSVIVTVLQGAARSSVSVAGDQGVRADPLHSISRCPISSVSSSDDFRPPPSICMACPSSTLPSARPHPLHATVRMAPPRCEESEEADCQSPSNLTTHHCTFTPHTTATSHHSPTRHCTPQPYLTRAPHISHTHHTAAIPSLPLLTLRALPPAAPSFSSHE